MHKEFGQTGIKVPVICFGAWQIGAYEWGNVSLTDAKDAINTALECGINFFDTADCYGLGKSEEILGAVLSNRRKDCFIATKGGIVKSRNGHFGFDASPKHLREAVYASLQRLKMEYVDLYQLHWPDPKIPIEDSVIELARLQKEGLIRYIGLSNCTLDRIKRACEVARIESLQPSYNMFYREIENGIIDFCQQRKISILPYNPLARGILAGKYSLNTQFTDLRHDDPMFRGKKYKFNLETVDSLGKIAAAEGISLLSLVLSWTLRFSGATSLITGVRNSAQIKEIANTPIILLTHTVNYAIDRTLCDRLNKVKKYFWYIELVKFFVRDKNFRTTLHNIRCKLRLG